ncbi:MAG: aminoacyl-tRNA hydrolase [Acidimicrobiales bacterium]
MSVLSRRSGEPPRRGTPADLLVIGLGNPGSEFDKTRHNVGADAVIAMAARHGQTLSKGKERALVAELRVGHHRVAVAFPQTFMNNSGESVRLLARRFGVEEADKLVVIHDELDLDVGRIKLKAGGGLAGHNGLRSITQHVGTTDYLRLRIGVGRPPASQLGRDYVLRRPGKSEQIELEHAIERSCDAIEQLLADGLEATMNTVNRRAKDD